MSLVYVNKGKSFEYNLQLGKKSVMEYADASPEDLSSAVGIDIPDEPEPD